MNIFEKMFPLKTNVTNVDGEKLSRRAFANMLDTILISISKNNNSTVYSINMELRRCGFFISTPDLKLIMHDLQEDGLLFMGSNMVVAK